MGEKSLPARKGREVRGLESIKLRAVAALLSSRLREEGPCARRRRAEVGGRDPFGLGERSRLKQLGWVGAPLPGSSVGGTSPTLSGGGRDAGGWGSRGERKVGDRGLNDNDLDQVFEGVEVFSVSGE